MRRAAAAVAAALAAAGIAVLAASLALEGGPAPAPGALTAASKSEPSKPAESRRRRTSAPPLPESSGVDVVRRHGRPEPDPALSQEEETEAQEEMLEVPDGVDGPIVVGRVVSPEDPDPDCWVALESVEDPARADPSEVETLPGGRFRLTKFPPGRYRVRARLDGAPATYSREVDARSGSVADAGVLRLAAPGCVSGVVRDAAGEEVVARVHLLGRHPASLSASILASVNSTPKEGFALRPHETGEFDLAVESDAGWAVHRGKTNADAIAGADVRLEPWGAVRGRVGEAAPGGAEARLHRVEVEALDAPPLGRATEKPALALDGNVGRLPAGKYRVTVRWTEGAEAAAGRSHAAEVVLAAGGTAEVVAPR